MAGFPVEAGKWKGLEGAEGTGVGKSPGVPRLRFVIHYGRVVAENRLGL